MSLKLAILSYTDMHGGAAKASYRVHHSLRSLLQSSMLVAYKDTNDLSVKVIFSRFQFFCLRLKNYLLRHFIPKFFQTTNPVLHSPGLFCSGVARQINKSDYDLVNLHWINYEFMSISEISRIKKPVVWTLHDMWAFCGGEHYTNDSRWVEGYNDSNRPKYESGIDLNKAVWNRKHKWWKKKQYVISPSHWLADCVRKSALMKDWTIKVIPNPIDTKEWKVVSKQEARERLKLPLSKKLVLFGAIGGKSDPRKGYDLLQSALDQLGADSKDIQLMIFGESAPAKEEDIFKTYYFGEVKDETILNDIYSAADMFVLPSRQDNLPNTAVEALASGTPVIAFDTCGLKDLVVHKQNGYLAQAFNTQDFAEGIKWILEDSERQKFLSVNAREFAVSKFSEEIVSKQYFDFFMQVHKENN